MKIWPVPSSAKWHSCKQDAVTPHKSYLFMKNIIQPYGQHLFQVRLRGMKTTELKYHVVLRKATHNGSD